MPYNYDYFISYAHCDNQPENGRPGFVDEFVRKLKLSPEHQKIFDGEVRVFFDKTGIRSMADWDNQICSALKESRFMIALLSPGYFQSEYCAQEFSWWIQHEMHRKMLCEGTAPIQIVNVDKLYDYSADVIPDIPAHLQKKYPNWVKYIRKIQSGDVFDLRELNRDKIDVALTAIGAEAKIKVDRQNRGEKSPSNNNYPRFNENFVGRRSEIERIHRELNDGSRSVIVINGLGGIGKTELALTYGQAYSWDYELGLVFVNCENQTSLNNVILSSGIAEMHDWNLPKGSETQQMTFLKSHLNKKRDEIFDRNKKHGELPSIGTHLLLILDNVDKPDLVKRKNLDTLDDFCHVIVTTRMSKHRFSRIRSSLSLDKLSEDESIELLENLRSFSDSEAESEAAHKIAKLLDGFTLAIELIGAYLSQKSSMTYEKMYRNLQNDYDKTVDKIIDGNSSDLARHQSQRISAVLKSTFDVISDKTKEALQYAALMAPDAIAIPWLQEFTGISDDEWEDVLEELTGYDLITLLKDSNKARMHRLVSRSVNELLISEEERSRGIQKIRNKVEGDLLATDDLIIVQRLIKDQAFWCNPENAWQLSVIWEFYSALKNRKDGWSVESSEEQCDWKFSDMFRLLGGMLEFCGEFSNAQNSYEEFRDIAYQRWNAFPTVDSAKYYVVSCSLCGRIKQVTGDVAEAQNLYLKGLELTNSILAQQPDNAEVLKYQCYINRRLGDLEFDKQNRSVANSYYQNSIENIKKCLTLLPDGDYIKDVALGCYYDYMSDWVFEQGDFSQAEELCQKALDIAEKLSRVSPNDIAVQEGKPYFQEKLVRIELASNNLETAIDYSLQAIEATNRLSPKMKENIHITRLLYSSCFNLGILLYKSGNFAQAKDYFSKAKLHCDKIAEKCQYTPKYMNDKKAIYAVMNKLEQNQTIDSFEPQEAGSWFGWLFGRK